LRNSICEDSKQSRLREGRLDGHKLETPVCYDGGYNLILTRAINGQRVKIVDLYSICSMPPLYGGIATEVSVYKALSPGYT